MAVIFLIIAGFAALCLLPGDPLSRMGISVPAQWRRKRLWQIVLFAALILAMLTMRLVPFALLLLIVGAGVIGNSIWQERVVTDDLQDEGEGDGHHSAGFPAALSGKMTIDEAHAFLGLSEGATPDEIDAAYRRLITQIHPDKGGTDYLAAKINDARDTLKRAHAGRAGSGGPVEDDFS